MTQQMTQQMTQEERKELRSSSLGVRDLKNTNLVVAQNHAQEIDNLGTLLKGIYPTDDTINQAKYRTFHKVLQGHAREYGPNKVREALRITRDRNTSGLLDGDPWRYYLAIVRKKDTPQPNGEPTYQPKPRHFLQTNETYTPKDYDSEGNELP